MNVSRLELLDELCRRSKMGTRKNLTARRFSKSELHALLSYLTLLENRIEKLEQSRANQSDRPEATSV